jgi:hypothetical protein
MATALDLENVQAKSCQQRISKSARKLYCDHYKSSSSSGRGWAAASAISASYWRITLGSTVTSGGANAGDATNSRLGFLHQQ